MIRPRKPPYGDTKKDAESTILDINRMLRDYGVASYEWTTMWDVGRVELKLLIEEEGGRKTPVRLVAPAFLAKRKTWDPKLGKHRVVEAPNWSQSMRLFFWYVKTKIEAIAYGLKDVQGEFLSDVVVRDAQGRDTTVGELIRPAIASGQLDLKALPDETPAARARRGDPWTVEDVG